jgi:hypothetical protein
MGSWGVALVAGRAGAVRPWEARQHTMEPRQCPFVCWIGEACCRNIHDMCNTSQLAEKMDFQTHFAHTQARPGKRWPAGRQGQQLLLCGTPAAGCHKHVDELSMMSPAPARRQPTDKDPTCRQLKLRKPTMKLGSPCVLGTSTASNGAGEVCCWLQVINGQHFDQHHTDTRLKRLACGLLQTRGTPSSRSHSL